MGSILYLQLPPHPQQTLPQTQKRNLVASPVTFSLPVSQKLRQSSSSVTSGKPQPSTPAPQKLQQSLQKRTDAESNSKNKAKLRPYIAPAIEIRVAIARNAS